MMFRGKSGQAGPIGNRARAKWQSLKQQVQGNPNYQITAAAARAAKAKAAATRAGLMGDVAWATTPVRGAVKLGKKDDGMFFLWFAFFIALFDYFRGVYNGYAFAFFSQSGFLSLDYIFGHLPGRKIRMYPHILPNFHHMTFYMIHALHYL